jgi:two-component system chemotaxis sensor kinase CheA
LWDTTLDGAVLFWEQEDAGSAERAKAFSKDADMSGMSDDGMEDIIREFLVESNELLDQLDSSLVELEKEPESAPLLAAIFRAVHTIKGTGGVLGFTRVEAVAHNGESLLSRMRDGKLKLNPRITSALLAMSDALRWYLKQIESTGEDGERDFQEVKDLLASLLNSSASSPSASVAATAAQAVVPDPNASSGIRAAVTAPIPPEKAESKAAENKPAEAKAAEVKTVECKPAPASEGPAAAPKAEARTAESKEPAENQKAPAAPSAPEAAVAGAGGGAAQLSQAASNVRVDVGLLDKVMDLVGELVLARNQILQYTQARGEVAFVNTAQRLNLITTELQEAVMKTRMQPIGNVWNKFPRIVRDLALAFGKQVRLELEGSETELDKTIIEAVKDPLMHIVRNSMDHGLETPERRRAAGKPAEGTLTLRAFHEGGQVNIEIIDDGAGIDLERVRQKAVRSGLVSAEQAGRMSERELMNLIFRPGFSTAEKVTNVSGRGVGMDVVRTNIERIGGAVDVYSTPGRGTTLKIKIPLTLAIIPALIVSTCAERFAIPQVSLLELVRLDGEQSERIERIHGAPVYRLRGHLLPLVFLRQQLYPGRSGRAAGEPANIVVLQAGDRQFGLVVDEINDTEEIVVKPLGKQLKGISAFAGATIMGDGKVALILDVLGLAQQAALVTEKKERTMSEATASAGAGEQEEKQSWLVFQVGRNGQMAVPLALVARLEEFSAQSVERTAQEEVVQYRGQIMPLLRIADALGVERSPESEDELQVIVYTKNGRSVGLVVDRILDVVEQGVAVESRALRPGILGSAVIRQRVTDMLDLPALVAENLPAAILEARS